MWSIGDGIGERGELAGWREDQYRQEWKDGLRDGVEGGQVRFTWQ